MKYFFHMEDGVCIRDPNGTEFPDDAAAMDEAAKVAHVLSKELKHAQDWRVYVKNAVGRQVGSVQLTDSNASPTGLLHPIEPIH